MPLQKHLKGFVETDFYIELLYLDIVMGLVGSLCRIKV